MALLVHRSLAMPVWAVAFCAIAVAGPLHPLPPLTTFLGIAVIAFTTLAMVRWHQMSRELKLPVVLIPGAREAGRLTRATADATVLLPEGPSSMDAPTTAERQREGGGAPGQRRSPRGQSRWNVGHMLQQWIAPARALVVRRVRTNHV